MTEANRDTILTLDEVEAASFQALTAAGASDVQAAAVARSIRAAEAEGTRGIGLGFLPYYCQHLRVGKIKGDAQTVVSVPALIRVDAASGFAHPAYEAAEEALVTKVNELGIALLGVTSAYACAVLGYLTDRLARQGLIALMTANASSALAVYGGKTPFFGTNFWSF